MNFYGLEASTTIERLLRRTLVRSVILFSILMPSLSQRQHRDATAFDAMFENAIVFSKAPL